ncbi:MAG: hypothetical protein IK071_08350 [Lachnospiraceae bacterium]|nr:hypothetical protein [Lachnospiraceae bacterium]
MKNLLTRNIGLKLISLVIAAVIWFAIMNIADPVVSETFPGIHVDVVNDEVITSRGYQYTIESGDRVDIICKGKRSVVNSLTSSDFKAEADFTTLNSMYMAGITVECTSAYAADEVVLSQRTENMAIKLEDQKTEPFSVRIEQVGAVRDGYYCYGTSLSSSLIQVSGAASQVAFVKEVVAYVDLTDKTETFTANCELVAYDMNGEEIDSMKLNFNPNTVEVTVQIFKTKTVDIEVTPIGTPIAGYYVEKLDYAPSYVTLAAEEDVLRNIDKLTIEYDVTGLSKYTEAQILLDDLITQKYGDTAFTVDNQAYVAIAVTVVPFIEKTVDIREQDIEIRNVAEGLEYSINMSSGISITIRGAESILSGLTAQNLKLYVDMSGDGEGSFTRQIRSDYGSDIMVSGSVSIRLHKKVSDSEPTE